MIDTLLAIIDSLISLKQYRDGKLQRVYDHVIDPTFNDLLMIHRDYIEMFDGVLRMLPDERDEGSADYSKKLIAAADYLRQKRLEFEPVRIKLGAVTTSMIDKRLGPEVIDFLREVSHYFPRGFPNRTQTEASAIIHVIHDVQSDKVKLSDLQRYIRFTINTQRQDWSRVCEALARVKAKLATRL